ncbi:MAG: ATP-binding cassette domain-containing protein [Rhodobacteraceae bacterium]|nr:ATP-binding cassette domain-containing protein [Paracoccaceae bacterium]
MLRLESVRLRQGDFTLCASVEIASQARVAVLGPSGAGKSTLLSAIAGFLPLQSGRIVLNGTDITGMRPGERPISMVFQDANLFTHLSIAQNIGLGLRPDLRLSAHQTEQVRQALQVVGLAGLGACVPAQLSGGQQSRAALARVLVRDRPLVLLDEPFAALGPALKAEMLTLLAQLLRRTKASLLMITHDPADARRVAPQTLWMEEGHLSGPHQTATLLKNPPPALRAYLG